jgi:hypothetical protein
MAIGVMAVKTLSSETSADALKKCKLIYWRLLDIILKLDNIEANDGGSEYLNMGELGTDSRLE